MKTCPTCATQYPDDANFCPMDASRLVAAPSPAPVVARPVEKPAPQKDAEPAIADRFVHLRGEKPTPLGTTVHATDRSGGGAVQVLLVDTRALPTPAIAERALRELKQLGKAKSDRILRVVDQGKLPDGRLYVATDEPGGPTLEEIVDDEGPLPVARARAIALAVGEALVEAQKVGVIHRDLAPRNVVVGEAIRLTGFGVAEPVTDKIYGAPGFLSPEQAEGKPVDQRSNIYSLGALLYFMVTGQPPFSGDGATMVQQHLHVQPEPPSARRPGLPTEFDRIVLKALEKSGGRRHLTLRQLLNELEALPADAPAAPAPARTLIAAAAPEVKHVAHAVEAKSPHVEPAPAVRAVVETPVAERATVVEMPAPVMPVVSASTVIDAPAPAIHPVSDAPSVSDDVPRSAAAVDPQDEPVTPLPAPLPAPQLDAEPAPAVVNESAPQKEALPAAITAPMRPPAEAVTAPVPAGRSGSRSQTAKTVVTQRPAIAPTPQPGGAQQAQGQGRGPVPPGKKGFRETAWFKKGEIEEEMAKKAAEDASEDPLAGAASTEAVVDESSLTQEDRARLSLRTGRTEMMPVVKPNQLPGERMSDAEMLAEVNSSRKTMVIGGIVVAVLAVGAALLYFLR